MTSFLDRYYRYTDSTSSNITILVCNLLFAVLCFEMPLAYYHRYRVPGHPGLSLLIALAFFIAMWGVLRGLSRMLFRRQGGAST